MTTRKTGPSTPPGMIGPDEALQLVLENAAPLPPRIVPLADACGLKLAEPVRADRDYPPFARAMMDGYAVRLADAGRTVPVAGEVAAGTTFEGQIRDGQCVEIMTGAPCPAGTEEVVPKEHVRRNGNTVTLPRYLTAGQHIASQGSECPRSQVVLHSGDTITPLAVAVMASFGLESVRVTPRPTLAVVTTGGELVGPHQRPGPGQIRDSNGPMLGAMASDVGINRPSYRHAEDRVEAIAAALEAAADKDIALLTGGVSVGTYDLVPQALEVLGAEVVFHKVRQKPGKPLLFARRGPQLIFGLPGNPLASHLCFHRYVSPAIRKMSGKDPGTDPHRGQLARPVAPKGGRTYFVAARVERPSGDGAWLVHPMPGASSADIFASCGANSYAQIPPGKDEIPAGHQLPFTWIGNAPWTN